MDCLKCKKYASSYIDDEISLRLRKEIENHLKNCSACRTNIESLRIISMRLKELPRMEGELVERNRLMDSLHEQIPGEPLPKPDRIHPSRKKFAFAGAFVIVILLIVGFVLKMPQQTQPPFIYNSNQASMGHPSEPTDERSIDIMVQFLEYERINASQYEAYSEPVLGVYVYEPAPPVEGGNLPDNREGSIESG